MKGKYIEVAIPLSSISPSPLAGTDRLAEQGAMSRSQITLYTERRHN